MMCAHPRATATLRHDEDARRLSRTVSTWGNRAGDPRRATPGSDMPAWMRDNAPFRDRKTAKEGEDEHERPTPTDADARTPTGGGRAPTHFARA